MFHGCIEKVEKREKLKEFQPNLDIESNPEERRRVLEMVPLSWIHLILG